MLKSLLLLATVASLAATPAFADEGRKVAGPNGGRILQSVTPHVEFYVNAERKVQFTFLDASNRAIAPAAQSVTVTTGSRSAPLVLKFSRQGDILVADAPLPEGRNFPAVIELKASPEAEAVIEKFNLNLATCGECKHHEYACICGH